MRSVGLRRLPIAALLALIVAGCTGSGGVSSESSNDSNSSTLTPTSTSTSTSSTTEATTESTVAGSATIDRSTTSAVGVRSVSNPLWNPYDPDDFGEEFPSITALGDVPPPDSPQDLLRAQITSAAAGDTDRPLGAGCSPGEGALGDGIWAGGLTSARSDSITVDIVCLFPQQDDMFTAPNGLPCTGPFESADPCMTNSSDLLREVPMSPSVEIAVARLIEPPTPASGVADLAPTTTDEFLTYLELGTYTPFLVEVRAGVVVRVEQYRSLWLPGL